MYIMSSFKLEISHVLSDKSERLCSKGLHGHTWFIRVVLYGPGYTADYLSFIVEPIEKRFNYSHLNFFIKEPSPRNLAMHIARMIWDMLYNETRVNRLVVSVESGYGSDWTILGSWDSLDREDHNSLFTGADTGWRSPDVAIIAPLVQTQDPQKYIGQYDARIDIERNEAEAQFHTYSRTMTNVVQWKLYRDSLIAPKRFKGDPAVLLGLDKDDEEEEIKEE